MRIKGFLPILTAVVILPAAVLAQESGDTGVTETATRNPFWQVSFCCKGHYMVRLDRIASVSRHRYVLDGKVIVDEVTVDTNGQALARFYYLEPITDSTNNDSIRRITERGREIVDQAATLAGSEIHNMVAKTYPGTTHAKTIEYRLTSKDRLEALYASLRRAWESGEGRDLNVVQSKQ
jgi:hypothetical protein